MGNAFGMIPGLETDEWSNDACRGYVIMAMEDCGFSKKDIRRVVGQLYEFDHNNYKHKDFPLLSEKSHFTDDTVMTAAVAVGLIDGKGLPERTFCAVQHEMRFWGREYPHAGYGGMFRRL